MLHVVLLFWQACSSAYSLSNSLDGCDVWRAVVQPVICQAATVLGLPLSPLRQSHRPKDYYDVMFTVALAYWHSLMLSAVGYPPEYLESFMNLCHHRSSVLLLHAA